MEYAITTDNLSKNYGTFQALKGIDLRIPKGSFYGLLGPNGAGKTTTIGILTGLVNITSGSASILGYDVVKQYKKSRSLVGVSPQELNFDPFFPLDELLMLQAGYYGIKRKDARDRAMELLKQFGLESKINVKMRQLSGGMKRRVQIAKALVHDPPIIILDEPTAGVDIELRHMMWDYLTKINKEGKTILLTTHYIEEAEKLCDTVAIIDQGEIVIEGNPPDLIRKMGKNMICVRVNEWDTKKTLDNWDYTVVNNQLHIQTKTPDMDMPVLLNQLSKLQVQVLEVVVKKSSLEEVFIKLTGKSINV
ncbi:MAG: ABC transporter ATP-binding protein [Candidatus Marinimicrobia bacterium]|jgi:ABC-2 type transport system ATP-binding protein|nr:ABC transporter ATP-binding protein [Candidatus Neomarinimicrobiota bacterium]MBT3634543.1 ABC transporter ATP-binding protein [Candidatus Neomarinimicrobiota bacterium]MBT3683376.1 ABC transporter ATP-binding protein [Candidatus Neomarinimicrobiota bacterium]MBT3760197.1 ABC transporter ATP-binding protein [Candidatus Neomarinimicrobiota bacterium]MBT3896292.1 ABC transporter ATP-binding protein [Candidatus Neomarinimicrobiota bacterium]